VNLKNLLITKEIIEYDMRTNREQQKKLQQEQDQLNRFYCLIQDKICDKMQAGEKK
jgi:hypothetical protein